MPESSDRDGPPLAGIRVLDLSRVLAGPWATQLLADLGAEIIKVERPGTGDDTRHWGPPWFEGAGGAAISAYFASTNRGKRSIAIDIASIEGADCVRRLAAHCDVVVENFKVGDLARYGLGYASLSKVNPRLIYCSISGFGQSGPYADRAGYDFVIQAMGGLMSLTGEAGGEPMKAGVAIVDIMTGLYASNGILAALQKRERTGGGSHIDVALLDVQIATLANQAANYFASGKNPRRFGNAHPNIVPYQTFPCADRAIAIAVGNDRQFQLLCDALDLRGVRSNPAYATNANRVARREELVGILAEAFRRKPMQHWLDRLEGLGVPAGPVNNLSDVFDDPHVRDRGLKIESRNSSVGGIPGVACPIRFAGDVLLPAHGVPCLGEHTGEVLAELLDSDPAP